MGKRTKSYVPRIAVLGAGLAGLSAAQALRAAGHSALVLDKGRGPGGRSSTRRAAPFAFDHGAQYFTVREPALQERVDAWIASGLVRVWNGQIVALEGGVATPARGDVVRYVGVPGMNALAKHLARGLDVRTATRVDRVDFRDGTWRLAVGERTFGPFEHVISTLPAAQAAELFRGHSPLAARAAAVEMQPCFAVLLGFESRVDVAFDGAFVTDEALAWIARDSSKPGRPTAEAWVCHANPAWTREHWELDAAVVIAELTNALERALGVELPRVVHRDAQRWRFALASPALDEGILTEGTLTLAGDWCHGSRIEGAIRSGCAAAQHVLRRLAD